MTGKEIPFSLDRSDGRSLARQLVDGLRTAIIDGYYLAGDILPSYRELAPALGVSEIVTKAAFKQLGEEGFVVARPRIGTIVRNRAERQWRGHVVLVQPEGDDNYLQTIVAGSVRDAMIDAGYLFSQVCVRTAGKGGEDFAHLDAVLSRSADLVIAVYNRPVTFAHLAKKGVPYAAFGGVAKKPKGAVGLTRIDYDMAVPDFAAECERIGAKKVVEVYWSDQMSHTTQALETAGIAVERLHVEGDVSRGRLEAVRRGGFEVFARLVRERRLEKDAVYFMADDYLASGALMALACAGLRSPEDVRIAAWGNIGISNIYSREVSRMEMDPSWAGKQVAAAALEYLTSGIYPSATIGPQWIAGETLGAPKDDEQEDDRQ